MSKRVMTYAAIPCSLHCALILYAFYPQIQVYPELPIESRLVQLFALIVHGREPGPNHDTGDEAMIAV